MKKIDIKAAVISVGVTAVAAVAAAVFSAPSNDVIDSIRKPPLMPPSVLFPIVWSVLYVLMAVGAYIILTADAPIGKKNTALTVYGISLLLNIAWTLVFFTQVKFLPAFFIIIGLWFSVFLTIILYYRVNPLAAYLQVPYLLWVTFAAWLNYMIFMLNPQ